ncbi:unnamed protein product [Miscanthus lutarioriparius]|uniref:Uncharacterized protein n=1 Tax=Miscanthus lutarioriparius TaxID=422564 RepID=A0A811N9F8_9POAL|nr:unnamed protein product [Miscanthus lutarioriparius]
MGICSRLLLLHGRTRALTRCCGLVAGVGSEAPGPGLRGAPPRRCGETGSGRSSSAAAGGGKALHPGLGALGRSSVGPWMSATVPDAEAPAPGAGALISRLAALASRATHGGTVRQPALMVRKQVATTDFEGEEASRR